MKFPYRSTFLSLLVGLTTFVSVSSSNAAVLLRWGNGGGNGATPGNPILAEHVTGGTWSRTGITATGFGSGNAVVSGVPGNGTAFNSNKYFEFTIAPAEGYVLSLDSINLDPRISNSGTTWTVRSSLDSWTDNLIAPFTSTALTTVTLGSAFDSLTSAVTFRIYVWNSGGAAAVVGFHNVDGTNAVVGTVTAAVPEPSTYVLLSLAGLILVMRCRRKSVRQE